MKCQDCGKPVELSTGYRKVSGYERIQRVGGGTNAVALREPKEEYLCRWCVEQRSRGIMPEQQSLL